MYVRRKYKRKARRRQTRRAGRRMYKKARTVNTKKDLYFFKRTAEVVAYGAPGQSEVKISGNFHLDQLPNYTEYTNLFDRYKITRIKLTWHLRTSPEGFTGTSAIYPRMFFIKDYDDSNSPTNQSQIMEHGKCKEYILRPNYKLNMFIKPSVLVPVYRTGVTNSYSPKWNQWIDCADVDVPHYGFKAIIDSMATGTQLYCTATFYMAFKDTR